jgi:hypothetical protein
MGCTLKTSPDLPEPFIFLRVFITSQDLKGLVSTIDEYNGLLKGVCWSSLGYK